MVRHLALMVRVSPTGDSTTGVVRLSDVSTEKELPIHAIRLILTLEREPGATFTRGHVQTFADDNTFPIQGNAALFDALVRYIDATGST